MLHPNRSFLRQLNLYGSMSFPSPLSAADVTTIFELSPAFTSKKLRYIDLSSAPINASHLSLLQAQPQLVSLGLSHIPLLPLRDLTAFIKEKAPQIEILTLTNSTPEITRPANSAAGMVVVYSLLINPLTSSPLWFDLANPPPPPPGRLRVIELAAPLLKNLAKAKGAAWRVIRSNGNRGWCVLVLVYHFPTSQNLELTDFGTTQARRHFVRLGLVVADRHQTAAAVPAVRGGASVAARHHPADAPLATIPVHAVRLGRQSRQHNWLPLAQDGGSPRRRFARPRGGPLLGLRLWLRLSHQTATSDSEAFPVQISPTSAQILLLAAHTLASVSLPSSDFLCSFSTASIYLLASSKSSPNDAPRRWAPYPAFYLSRFI